MPFLVIFIIIVIVGAVVQAGSARPDIYANGRRMYEAFRGMGDMKGKTFSELQKVVGNPSSISHHANGTRLRQWQATGFHMAILFDGEDRVMRITHQFTKLPTP